MKRHPALVPLSDDHHTALVLARRLKREVEDLDAGGLASLEREVKQQFLVDLEPHFRVEEQWLLPALERAGATALTRRIAGDHARLRSLVHGVFTQESARGFGTLLFEHVRFEERVAFPEAERLLSADELGAVRAATGR